MNTPADAFLSPSLFRWLTAGLMAGLVAGSLPAQTTVSPAPGVPYNVQIGPPAPYKPSPTDSLGPGGRPPSKDEIMPFRGASPYRPETPGPFFLPTLLPVLGANTPGPVRPLAPNYPRECAGEAFFMAYGNLAANQELSVPRQERIALYLANRALLLAELREVLARTNTASSASRARALADLAASQAERLTELEREAEQIRDNLSRVEFLRATADDIGLVVPGKEPPGFEANLAAVRQLLSAAHFRPGFSPAQRRLLEEMAQEEQLVIEPEPGAAPAVFFWPAGARIPDPTNLDRAAAARFADFMQRKATLKAELRDLLDREHRRVFNVDFTDEYEALAAAQAPRFVALDGLADEIRPALAALAQPRTPLLPPELAEEVIRLAKHRQALQRELHEGLAEFRQQFPADQLDLLPQADGTLAITVAPAAEPSSRREALLTRLSSINREMADRFADFAAHRDQVRTALARYQATTPGVSPGRSPEQLASDFLAAQQAQQVRDQQQDYAAAVLATGLVPAQRRLLLAATAVGGRPGLGPTGSIAGDPTRLQ